MINKNNNKYFELNYENNMNISPLRVGVLYIQHILKAPFME